MYVCSYYFSSVSVAEWPPLGKYTVETHGRSLKKWACISPIFHAVVLLDSSN